MDLAAKHHLAKRGDLYHYRRRVPEHLRAAIGRREITVSLRTSVLKEAVKGRDLLDVEWQARFDAHARNTKAASGTDTPVFAKTLEPSERRRLVRDYVDERYRSFERWMAADGPSTNDQRLDVVQTCEEELSILGNVDDPRRDELTYHSSRRILKDAGHGIEPEAVVESGMSDLILRAMIELVRRKLAFLKGDHQNAFFDQLFGTQSDKSLSFGELADQFLKLKREEAVAKQTDAKGFERLTSYVTQLRTMIGDETPVQEITYDACLDLRSRLAALPAWRGQSKPSQQRPNNEAEARAGDKVISPFTQGQYLGALRSILDLGVRKGSLSTNVAESLRPIAADKRSAGEKRASFDSDQLKSLFSDPFYKPWTTMPGAGAGSTPWRFWLPVLCLFHGLRPREVCQLELSDVRQTDAGTWYLDINDTNQTNDGVQKSVKTANSRRQVPLHPEVIAMGFLHFVNQRGSDPTGSRIFHTLKPDDHGNPAKYPLKRFNEAYLPAAMTLKKGQTFYCLRHSWRDALRRNQAGPEVLKALGAWEQPLVTSDHYGSKLGPDELASYVASITFPGLSLSHLRVGQGQIP